MPNTPECPTRLLSLKQVLNRVPYSRTHIWRLETDGLFPQRVQVGPNRIGWLEIEVETWIQQRAQERNSGHVTDTNIKALAADPNSQLDHNGGER